jgi:hypothetical protein
MPFPSTRVPVPVPASGPGPAPVGRGVTTGVAPTATPASSASRGGRAWWNLAAPAKGDPGAPLGVPATLAQGPPPPPPRRPGVPMGVPARGVQSLGGGGAVPVYRRGSREMRAAQYRASSSASSIAYARRKSSMASCGAGGGCKAAHGGRGGEAGKVESRCKLCRKPYPLTCTHGHP